MKRLGGIRTKKIILKILIVNSLFFICSCSLVETKGNITGNDNSASNEINFKYKISETINFNSKISQPYQYKNNTVDRFFPDYAESGLTFEF